MDLDVTSLARTAMSPLLRSCYRIEVEGLHHVRQRGPVVLAPNHLSFTDPVFLLLAMPRPITFIAKAEYFDDWRTAWLFRGTGQIPLRRGNGFSASAALTEARRVLARGGAVGIFPEGTRSRDGQLNRGSSGPVRLALATGAPLIPVGLIGTDAVHFPGEGLPHLFRTVTVRFGAPMLVDTNRRMATEHMMRAIAALSGQEYRGRQPVAGAA